MGTATQVQCMHNKTIRKKKKKKKGKISIHKYMTKSTTRTKRLSLCPI